MPALLTRMSIWPKASVAVAMIRPAAVEVADRVVVGHGPAAGLLDLPADRGRRVLGRLAGLAGQRHPDVVHHHAGALGGQAPGDVPPDAPTRPGHHRHPSVEKSHRASISRPRGLRRGDAGSSAPHYHRRPATDRKRTTMARYIDNAADDGPATAKELSRREATHGRRTPRPRLGPRHRPARRALHLEGRRGSTSVDAVPRLDEPQSGPGCGPVRARLEELGLTLHGPHPPHDPLDAVVVHDGVARTSGQLPRIDGQLTCLGRLGDEVSVARRRPRPPPSAP